MFARTRLRAIASVLIVLIFTGTSATWHAGDDDLDFQQWSGPHDHRTHDEQLRSPAAAVPSQHCVLCHWVNAFRMGAQRTVRVVQPLVQAVRTSSASTGFVSSSIPLNVPPRAPPAIPA
jgi:hypothetical protein